MGLLYKSIEINRSISNWKFPTYYLHSNNMILIVWYKHNKIQMCINILFKEHKISTKQIDKVH